MQVQLAYRCTLVLRDIVNPYLLHRRKRDIGKMKRMHNKTEQLLFFWLRFRQRSMYEAYLTNSDVMHAMSGGSKNLYKDVGGDPGGGDNNNVVSH